MTTSRRQSYGTLVLVVAVAIHLLTLFFEARRLSAKMHSAHPPVGAHGLVASPRELASDVSTGGVYIAFGVVLPIALGVIGIGFFVSAYRHSKRGLESG